MDERKLEENQKDEEHTHHHPVVQIADVADLKKDKRKIQSMTFCVVNLVKWRE